MEECNVLPKGRHWTHMQREQQLGRPSQVEDFILQGCTGFPMPFSASFYFAYKGEWRGPVWSTRPGAKTYHQQDHSAKLTWPLCKSTWTLCKSTERPLHNGLCQFQVIVASEVPVRNLGKPIFGNRHQNRHNGWYWVCSIIHYGMLVYTHFLMLIIFPSLLFPKTGLSIPWDWESS